MTDRHFRQHFPALTDKAYFNYGGQGPLPSVAVQAIAQAYTTIGQLGPFSRQANDWVQQQSQKLRSTITTELGIAPTTLTLTEDVTVGCNIALWGIDWQPGDGLLLTDCEHQGIVAAVRELQRRFGIEVSVCPLLETVNGSNPVETIAQHVRSNTRLLVLSHILWNTGHILPLGELAAACKAQNPDLAILVDAAQSVGVLPLELSELGVDFYAFTGHKWWCGPEGVGGLYVSPQAREQLLPTFIGWRGVELDRHGNPIAWKSDGSKWEIATSAYPLYVGLQAAIALHSQWGTAAERYAQICRQSEALWRKLAAIPGVTCVSQTPPATGLVAFTLANGKHPQLVEFLETQGVFVRTILSPHCVRACVHYLTLAEEIDRLVAGVECFLATRQ
jgi:L-cysteine/cystine lyase